MSSEMWARGARRCAWWALWPLLSLSLVGPARAQDDEQPRERELPSSVHDEEDDDDGFNTGWFGVRLGLWYRPEIDFNVQIGGQQSQLAFLTGLTGTPIDVERQLGVSENATSEYSFQNGIPELEVFFDTRWLSLSLWGIAPYQYEGKTSLTRTIRFGGREFAVTTQIESKFRQAHAGLDVMINVVNNEFIKLSPVIGLRSLWIDWEVKDLTTGQKADSSDIDAPITFGEYQVIPYPELGLELRLGLREWVEVDAMLTGSMVDYYDVEGGTFTAEAGVTVYPIRYLGIRLGARYMDIEFESKSADPRKQYDFDLNFFGANLSLIARFG